MQLILDDRLTGRRRQNRFCGASVTVPEGAAEVEVVFEGGDSVDSGGAS